VQAPSEWLCLVPILAVFASRSATSRPPHSGKNHFSSAIRRAARLNRHERVTDFQLDCVIGNSLIQMFKYWATLDDIRESRISPERTIGSNFQTALPAMHFREVRCAGAQGSVHDIRESRISPSATSSNFLRLRRALPDCKCSADSKYIRRISRIFPPTIPNPDLCPLTSLPRRSLGEGGYFFFAFFVVLVLASLRRSVFLRREARFLTLSLPWLFPIRLYIRSPVAP